jgi:hypothetical protein
MSLRNCLRDPIPEIWDAARYLDAAVTAHLEGHDVIAGELFRLADKPLVREWTESIWGAKSIYVTPFSPEGESLSGRGPKAVMRMPTSAQKMAVVQRDGYHCRYCGIPVVRAEVKRAIAAAYPDAVSWGKPNRSQHASFQAMWLQFDHVSPHSAGGQNEIENLVISCAPCNFGKMHYSVAQLGLSDPRDRPPIVSTWDGLERFAKK